MKKIMVVDDDDSVLDSIKMGLEQLKPEYNITCVDSGRKCIDLLKNDMIPDAILLDIMMPGMNGWMVLDKIKKNIYWEDIQIIFITAVKDKLTKEVGQTYGSEYVEKPFKMEYLIQTIEKVLKTSRKY